MRTNCRSFAFAQDDNLALSSRVSGAIALAEHPERSGGSIPGGGGSWRRLMRTNCRSFAFAQDDNLALSSRVSGAIA